MEIFLRHSVYMFISCWSFAKVSRDDKSPCYLLSAWTKPCLHCVETADVYIWLVLLLLSGALMLIPLWWYISHHNPYTYHVLYTGWTPIIGAMVISRSAGLCAATVATWLCLTMCFLPDCDYVTFGPLLSQIRLSSVWGVRTPHQLRSSLVFHST